MARTKQSARRPLGKRAPRKMQPAIAMATRMSSPKMRRDGIASTAAQVPNARKALTTTVRDAAPLTSLQHTESDSDDEELEEGEIASSPSPYHLSTYSHADRNPDNDSTHSASDGSTLAIIHPSPSPRSSGITNASYVHPATTSAAGKRSALAIIHNHLGATKPISLQPTSAPATPTPPSRSYPLTTALLFVRAVNGFKDHCTFSNNQSQATVTVRPQASVNSTARRLAQQYGFKLAGGTEAVCPTPIHGNKNPTLEDVVDASEEEEEDGANSYAYDGVYMIRVDMKMTE